MATVPVSLDIVVEGFREVGAVQEAEHVEILHACDRTHIGRMVPLAPGDPLSA
jgi:hypothetical protein